MKKLGLIYLLWLGMVVAWNFGYPEATPFQDVVVVVLIATSSLAFYFWLFRGVWEIGGRAAKNAFTTRQQKAKKENKEKILEMLREKGEVSNDDVENAFGVSDSTATNYLQELEVEGKIIQKGRTGRGVTYIQNG